MMVYLDTSVALAHLFAEDVTPPQALWQHSLVSSRLLEHEAWTRVNSSPAGPAHSGDAVRRLLERVAFLELIPEVVARARDKFPVKVRTLDALHLASATFLIEQGVDLQLATYDDRMLQAARKMKIKLFRM